MESNDLMKELPRGIAVMTAWLEAKPGVAPEELVWTVLHEAIDEGPESVIEQSLGLAKLGQVLLAELSKLSGRDPGLILQQIASNYGG